MLRCTGLWKAILFTAFAAVLMHGTPASALVTITFKWDPPDYGDVVTDVRAYLEARCRVAVECGVDR